MNESTPENTPESIPENTPEQSESLSAFLPLTLLAISFALLLISLDTGLSSQRTALKETVAQRDQFIRQSPQVQASLQKLFVDLSAIAKDDSDAQAIISRSGIQLNPPQAPAPAK